MVLISRLSNSNKLVMHIVHIAVWFGFGVVVIDGSISVFLESCHAVAPPQFTDLAGRSFKQSEWFVPRGWRHNTAIWPKSRNVLLAEFVSFHQYRVVW